MSEINGIALKLLRVSRGVKARIVAKETHIPAVRISRIETGRSKPRPEEVSKILGFLGVAEHLA